MGFFEALGAACLWGTSGIFAVHLFRLGLTPESLALLRPVVGLLGLATVFGITDPRSLRLPGRDLLWVTLGGGLSVGAFQLAYQMSTAAVGVPTTVALLYLAPVIVVAVAGPLLGEWPTPRRVVLSLLTLAGVWLTILGAERVAPIFDSAGLGWGVLAGASYAAYTVFGRFAAPRVGTAATTVYSLTGACILLALGIPAAGSSVTLPSSLWAWVLLISFGALTIGVAQLLFFHALTSVEASRASIATAAEPAVAALLAAALLSQGLSPVGWAGVALVVGGVGAVGFDAGARQRA